MDAFEDRMQRGGMAAIREASRFFMKDDPVHQTLREITRRLEESGIPYAVVGGMALVAQGYDRTTIDVDVLVTGEGLDAIRRELVGGRFETAFRRPLNLRDTETGVRIEFVVSGQYPGDGKPKPVAFLDPAQVAVENDGIRYVSLPVLIEMKLASGMTNPGRLRDLADVQELIRVLSLPAKYAEQLNPYVQNRFAELWSALRDGADSA